MLTMRPNFRLRHPRQKRLDERNRRQHVRLDTGQDVVPGDRFEGLEGRAAVVIDQDVGVRAGCDQRRPRGRIIEIASNLTNADAGRLANFARRSCELYGIAPVDEDFSPGLSERERTGAAQSFARGADDRLAADNSKIQRHLRCSTAPTGRFITKTGLLRHLSDTRICAETSD